MSWWQVSSKSDDRTGVLILIKGLGLGGAENLIAESAPLWDTSTFEYRVAYLLPWKHQLVAKLTDRGIPVTCLDWRGPADIGGLIRLRRLLREWRPEIVHSHLPVAGILGRVAATTSRNVYTEHNVVDYYRQPTKTVNRLTYRLNDVVIAVSDAVATSIARYPGPDVRVIPNGVVVPDPDSQTVQAVRRELGIDATTPLIVHVGNIRPHKGHRTLIDAMKLLARFRPDILTVSIGGEKVPGDLERMRSRSASLGVADRIKFLGRRDDALAFMATADVVVNPSDVEGLPLSVLEAMALARPVVATAVGGVPTVVRNEETGLLIEAGDSEALARAIEHALESPRAAEWGQAASRLVSERHGLEAMVRSYEDVYRELST